MPQKQPATPFNAPRPRLVAARSQRGWSQQDLADQLGTTPLNISRWERGLTTPNPYFRQKLADLFGASFQDLDGRVEEVSPPAGQQASSSQQAGPQACWDPAIPVPTGLLPLVGREQELTRLKEQLQAPQKVVLSALSGLPGVGKTALALALVYDANLRHLFTDGILWAGLGPHANLLTIFTRWGRLLGLSQSDCSEMQAPLLWARCLQARIGQRRMLLVLDDVWDLQDALACQVGGPACAYLLTTRLPPVALAFAGSNALAVSELEEEASLRLLQQLAPQVVEQEPQQVHYLLQQVGGLPLALCLMGHYLRMQSYGGQPRRIRAAINRLRSSEARLQLSEARPLLGTSPVLPGGPISLHAVIATSEQQLTQRARAALRALSVLPAKPNSFAEEVALTVSQQPVEALDELSDAGLVESVGPGRYSLHQTIADYARLHLREAEPKQRLLAYSVGYAQEHESDSGALQRENSMLLAALEASVELERGEELLRLCLLLAPFWKSQGEYTLAQQYLPRALEVAQQLVQHKEQVRLLLLLGDIAHQRGDDGQAEEHYQQALSMACQEGNQEQVRKALEGLNWIAYSIKSYPSDKARSAASGSQMSQARVKNAAMDSRSYSLISRWTVYP